jgi:hypothetical protein
MAEILDGPHKGWRIYNGDLYVRLYGPSRIIPDSRIYEYRQTRHGYRFVSAEDPFEHLRVPHAPKYPAVGT